MVPALYRMTINVIIKPQEVNMRVKILTLGIISLLMLGSVLSAEKEKQDNFWQGFFPDHLEVVYIIMKDGTSFSRTSHYETKVHMSIGKLEEMLKKFKDKDYDIKHIAIIIHNHFSNRDFSPEDRKQYSMLKKYGFKGLFLMYCHGTNKAYDIEDEEEPK